MLLSNIVEAVTKVIKKMEWGMDLGLFIMRKVEDIVVNGERIKWKEEEHYTMEMDNWLMRVNGNLINYTDLEYYITKILFI